MSKSQWVTRSSSIAILFSAVMASISFAATPASDSASDPAYASGFTTGTNGGTGFGPWNIVVTMGDSTSNGGSFINTGSNDPTNLPPPVFDIWNQNSADNDGYLFSDETTATRPFDGAMTPNQSFSFQDVLHYGNSTQGGGSFLGWSLQDSSGDTLLDLHTGGGLPGYYLTDNENSLTLESNLYYNYDAADKFIFTLNDSAGDYTLFVQGNVVGGSQTLTGQIDMSTGGPSQFEIYDNNGGYSSDIQFNNLTITAPGTSKFTAAGSGDWNNPANWSGLVPNGVGNEADLFSSISTPQTIYTNIPITLDALHFNNTSTYVLAGAGSLTLQAATGASALVQVDQGTQEINIPVTVASNTTFNVASGATLLIADPITINSGIALTQAGSGTVTYESLITVLAGGSLSFGNSSIANSLSLGSGAKASIAAHIAGASISTLQVYNLSMSGGKLDLANNALTIAYGTGADPVSTIKTELVSGYDHGAWDGVGIDSSAVAAHRGTSIGYKDTGTSVQVMFTWDGDLNLDGVVNAADLAAMQSGNGSSWTTGDLNYDGVKNADDWSLFNLGAAVGAANISTLAPEPAAAVICLAAIVVPCTRSRRRR
jgi:hypothetical protein